MNSIFVVKLFTSERKKNRFSPELDLLGIAVREDDSVVLGAHVATLLVKNI